jgi:hypothetical protein
MENQAILSEPAQEYLIPVQEIPIDEATAKSTCDWFMTVNTDDGTARIYTKEQIIPDLRRSITCGTVHLEDTIDVCAKTETGEWIEKQAILKEFVDDQFSLLVLYQPVWAHAMAGLKWGAIIGIGIKAIDTLITFATIDPLLAVFFLAAVAIFIFPRYGFIAAAILAFNFIRSAGFDGFFSVMTMTLVAALTATFTGAILGCLPGMFIGGMTGFFRRNIIPHANDIDTEPDHLILKAVIIPLIGGVALICFYLLVFNPWLIRILQ